MKQLTIDYKKLRNIRPVSGPSGSLSREVMSQLSPTQRALMFPRSGMGPGTGSVASGGTFLASSGKSSGVYARPNISGGTAAPFSRPGPASSQSPFSSPQPQTWKDLVPKQSISGGINRSKFDEQLKDPAVRAAIAARAQIEVGSQPKAQQAFIETVFNRADARHKSLIDTVNNSDGYYPKSDDSKFAAYSQNASTDHWSNLINEVQRGSNITNGATGNQSGNVKSGGAPITYSADGEEFIRENIDAKWQPEFSASQSAQETDMLGKPLVNGKVVAREMPNGIDPKIQAEIQNMSPKEREETLYNLNAAIANGRTTIDQLNKTVKDAAATQSDVAKTYSGLKSSYGNLIDAKSDLWGKLDPAMAASKNSFVNSQGNVNRDTLIAVDAVSKKLREMGYTPRFISGGDEHSQNHGAGRDASYAIDIQAYDKDGNEVHLGQLPTDVRKSLVEAAQAAGANRIGIPISGSSAGMHIQADPGQVSSAWPYLPSGEKDYHFNRLQNGSGPEGREFADQFQKNLQGQQGEMGSGAGTLDQKKLDELFPQPKTMGPTVAEAMPPTTSSSTPAPKMTPLPGTTGSTTETGLVPGSDGKLPVISKPPAVTTTAPEQVFTKAKDAISQAAGLTSPVTPGSAPPPTSPAPATTTPEPSATPVFNPDDVPAYATGGSKQSPSGEPFVAVDKKTGKDMFTFSPGESMSYDRSGRIDVTPRSRTNPRDLVDPGVEEDKIMRKSSVKEDNEHSLEPNQLPRPRHNPSSSQWNPNHQGYHAGWEQYGQITESQKRAYNGVNFANHGDALTRQHFSSGAANLRS